VFLRRFAFAVCCALALLAGCSTHSEVAAPSPGNAFGLPVLSDLSKLASANSDEFLIRQDGMDFASLLPHYNVTANGSNGDFAPAWSLSPPELTNAAYCIYRLTYNPADAPIKLTLNWNAPPALNTDCWIGISNWTTGNWALQTLPVDSVITLDNPADYVNASQECYVAVLMLGDSPCSLATVGYGTPPPPPNGDGYTLVAPLTDMKTYLIDMDGNEVHTWTANLTAGATAKLLENGDLLRAGNLHNSTFGSVGGAAGRITEFDWDSNAVWHYDHSSSTECTHHDFTVLPNGNILMIMWVAVPDADVLDAGRAPGTFTSGKFWADSIIEVQPVQPSGGNIVWQWNVMDHVVQDYDQGDGHYGDPAQHPELVDINYPAQITNDWTHINSVAYNAQYDQIMLTTPNLSEIWVIDHSTTTLEAAGSTGGTYGHGGDLLYRWGNPAAYRGGPASDQQLFGCHNGHWNAPGLDGAGDILIFNDKAGQAPNPPYSSIVQITAPQNVDGSYHMDGTEWGPQLPTWSFIDTPPDLFYSPLMGSAQRLPGGDTLICSAVQGWIFEVDATGVLKWEYHNQHPNANASVFAVLRYPPDYPGLANLP